MTPQDGETIWVRMGANGAVFLPGSPETRRIDLATGMDRGAIGAEPVSVVVSRFIRRRLEKGDLVQVDDPGPGYEPPLGAKVPAGPQTTSLITKKG